MRLSFNSIRHAYRTQMPFQLFFILAESKQSKIFHEPRLWNIAILEKTGWSVYLNTETLFHATLSVFKNMFKIQKALIIYSPNQNYLEPHSSFK